MFKVNNKDTRTTPIAYFTPCSSVSIVNFKHVIAYWEQSYETVTGKSFKFLSIKLQQQARIIIYPNKLHYIAKSLFHTVKDVKSCKNATTICMTALEYMLYK